MQGDHLASEALEIPYLTAQLTRLAYAESVCCTCLRVIPQDPVALDIAEQLVEAVNTHGYKAAAVRGRGLPRGLEMDSARRKDKEIYEGEFKVGCRTVPYCIS